MRFLQTLLLPFKTVSAGKGLLLLFSALGYYCSISAARALDKILDGYLQKVSTQLEINADMHARLIWINGLLAILISLPIFLSLSGAALNQIMKRSPLKKFPSTLLSSLQVSIRGEFFALRRLCYYLLIFILLAIFYSAIIYEGSLFVRAIFCFFAALLLFLGFGRAFSTLISPLVAAIFHFEPLAAYNEAFSLCMHKRREILLLLLISIGIVLGGLFVRDELCRVAMNYIGGGYIYLGILGLIRQTYP